MRPSRTSGPERTVPSGPLWGMENKRKEGKPKRKRPSLCFGFGEERPPRTMVRKEPSPPDHRPLGPVRKENDVRDNLRKQTEENDRESH